MKKKEIGVSVVAEEISFRLPTELIKKEISY